MASEQMDLLPPIADYLAHLERLVRNNPLALRNVGGNILIHVFDVGSVTIVTSGPYAGFHRTALEVPVAFAMMVEEWLLLEMLDPECNPNLDQAAEGGFFAIEGDPDVYERLMGLGEKKSALSIRAGRAA